MIGRTQRHSLPFLHDVVGRRQIGVHQSLPTPLPHAGGKLKRWLSQWALNITYRSGWPCQPCKWNASVPRLARPVRLADLDAVPAHAVDELLAAQGEMALAQAIIRRTKRTRPAFFRVKAPVDPGDVIVLTVGVVVAAAASGRTRRLATGRARPAKSAAWSSKLRICRWRSGVDVAVVRRPFVAAVVAEIVVPAVAVVLAVGLVVLAVVTDQIVEREAVVAGDEVDRVIGMARRSP